MSKNRRRSCDFPALSFFSFASWNKKGLVLSENAQEKDNYLKAGEMKGDVEGKGNTILLQREENKVPEWREVQSVLDECTFVFGFHPDQVRSFSVLSFLRKGDGFDRRFWFIEKITFRSGTVLYIREGISRSKATRWTSGEIIRVRPLLFFPAVPPFFFVVHCTLDVRASSSLTPRDLCDWIMEKDASIQKEVLPFEGKNVVLYSFGSLNLDPPSLKKNEGV